MDSLFNQATNLTEPNQGIRGDQIYKYMTTGFDEACSMPNRYLQGNKLTNKMAPVVDVETILRQSAQMDYVNNSRADAEIPAVPMQGLDFPDCQQQIQTGYVKYRVTDRETDAPELVLRGGVFQTGVMQLGEDTRTTFKYSAQAPVVTAQEDAPVAIASVSAPTMAMSTPTIPKVTPSGDQTLHEALVARDKAAACKLSFRTYPATC